MMTEQEIFSTAYKHAKSMNNLAKRSDGGATCFYRAPNGEKCLIGSFIPDFEYEEAMEGALGRLLYRYSSIFRPLGLISYNDLSVHNGRLSYPDQLDRNRLFFLESLQTCHDGANTKEDMIEKLIEFAKKRSLEIPQ